jgi:hypothetical protein
MSFPLMSSLVNGPLSLNLNRYSVVMLLVVAFVVVKLLVVALVVVKLDTLGVAHVNDQLK